MAGDNIKERMVCMQEGMCVGNGEGQKEGVSSGGERSPQRGGPHLKARDTQARQEAEPEGSFLLLGGV